MTPNERATAKRAIDRAVIILDGQANVAKAMGVSQQTVWNWVNAGCVPVQKRRCLQLEAATRGLVTRYQLRPDVYGEEPATALYAGTEIAAA